jgi:hypothetical protein
MTKANSGIKTIRCSQSSPATGGSLRVLAEENWKFHALQQKYDRYFHGSCRKKYAEEKKKRNTFR